ncbi:MAG: hypothetical protein ACFFCX_17425, partial [Candidatus Sifarchaeia archaeon]
ANTLLAGIVDVLLFVGEVINATTQLFDDSVLYLIDETPNGFALSLLIMIGVVSVAALSRRRRVKKKSPLKKQSKEGPRSYEPKTMLPNL